MTNFDQIQDRHGTDSVKWNVKDNELPMWIADMDFRSPDCVVDAITKRAQHGIYGYTELSDAWYDAIVNRWERLYQTHYEKEWLLFTTGVLSAITSSLKRISNVGDKVVVLTPIYGTFYNSIVNTGRQPYDVPLVYEDYSYKVDFQALEQAFSDPLSTVMILCNPHNPTGYVWTKEELITIANLAKKHDVTILSDEIHCDLTRPGVTYTPFLSVCDIAKEIGFACISPSKTFNTAGIQSAAMIVPNEKMRKAIRRGINSDEVAEPNVFAGEVLVAAYNEGDSWMMELRKYIFENRDLLDSYLKENLPDAKSIKGDATYLAWVDVSSFTNDSSLLSYQIRKQTGLFLSSGNYFHGNGKTCVRINLACPKSVLLDGLNRLNIALNNIKQNKGEI